MKYSSDTWDLVQALESASPASFKIPATFIDSIRPNKYPENETNKPEMRFNFQQIALSCLVLRRMKLGLGKVDLEPSPKRGIYKINMLK